MAFNRNMVVNLRNAIKDSSSNRDGMKGFNRNLKNMYKSGVRYNTEDNSLERNVDETPESVKKHIKELTEKLNEEYKMVNNLSTATRKKGVSYQASEKFSSNAYNIHRNNINKYIKLLEALGCRVRQTRDGYTVTESCDDSPKEYTNEDIKNMRIKIYEAYLDDRILEEDKDELLELLESAIDRYNKESMR